MERKKYILITILSAFSLILVSQNNIPIYRAFLSGDMTKWKFSMDSIEAKKPKTNKDNLDLINYQYGYIGWCIGQKKKAEAEKYMAKTEKLIELLEKNRYNLSMLHAYKATMVGFEIGLSPYKAPFIGQQSLTHAAKAIELDSQNAFAYIQLGNIDFYTPKVFGGSKQKAITHYVKALKLMQSEKGSTLHNWNYMNLLATIINAYMKVEDYETAKKYAQRTLIIEPEFDWVKNRLYPELLKK